MLESTIDKQLRLDWGGFPSTEGSLLEYPFTNESIEQIVRAMDLQGHEKVAAIVGGGEQALAMLAQLPEGQVYGFDINPTQIISLALKVEMINVLSLNEYVSFVKSIDHLEPTIVNSLEKLIRTIEESQGPQLPVRQIYSSLKYLNLKTHSADAIFSYQGYFSIKRNVSNLNLSLGDLREGLNFPDESLDWVYLSNTVDYLSPGENLSLVQEVARVLVRGGRVYACSYGDFSNLLKLRTSGLLREDFGAYKRGNISSSRNLYGNSPIGKNFYVGQKIS